MGSVIAKEKSISQSQYLDFVYSQSKTLYDSIPQAPRPSIDPAEPPTEVPVDGSIGSIQSLSEAKPAKQPQTTTPTPSTSKVSTEFNSIQSNPTPGNNKRKGKYTKKNLETNRRIQNQPPTITIKGKERKISISAMRR